MSNWKIVLNMAIAPIYVFIRMFFNSLLSRNRHAITKIIGAKYQIVPNFVEICPDLNITLTYIFIGFHVYFVPNVQYRPEVDGF